MRLGTYWLVRIGIAMVLTALVFFGNLAYQNYISRMGPGGKVALLYVVSAGLLGAGAWWQRKSAKESLRNYGQVLFAGGLAAVYFTTYAAHHVERLRVIESARLDGLLLLAWAGFMVWIAERKKSEVLALFAVGLAYYTSIITEVGYFTLYSNLVLASAAVYFLVRNRWATLSYGSLVATYLGYAFWRFHGPEGWHLVSPEQGLWSGVYFLAAYWVVFTAGLFLSRAQPLAGTNRATFLTLNNGAFFAGFLLTMLQVREGGFWKFSLVFGSVLLLAALAARIFLPSEPLTKNAYLAQGLLLVTVGFISKYAGLQLALVLGMESVVLLGLGHLRRNLVLEIGALLAAGLSVAWAIDGMSPSDPSGLWLGSGLCALMLLNGWQSHRHRPVPADNSLRGWTTFFVLAAFAILVVTAWDHTARANFPLVLLIAGLVLTLSVYLLVVPEVAYLSQGLVLAGNIAWLAYHLTRFKTPPPVSAGLAVGTALILMHWWQRQRKLPVPPHLSRFWQGIYSLALVVLIFGWARLEFETSEWLAMASVLAVGLTAYAAVTRAWLLAAVSQLYTCAAVLLFAARLSQGPPAGHLAFAPIAALAALAIAAVLWLERKPAQPEVTAPVLQLARGYRWTALGMGIWWVLEYVPTRERIWLLAFLGLICFAWAGWQRSREGLLFSAAFTLSALALFWVPLVAGPTVYGPNLVALIALLAQRQVARRLPDRYPLPAWFHGAVIVVGGLSLWVFLSRWVLQAGNHSYLTASWSALALCLFAAGIVLRERVYRWLGLGVLACAIARVMMVDLTKLETVYRILSFMALGIVLLVLGFIYNKYQEKIRQWL